MKRLLIAVAAALVCAAPAAAAGPGPLDQTGTLHGANYRIIVPATWNGGLVVLAHGYRDRADHTGEVDNTSPMDAGFTAIAGGLASQGYAVAASAYKTNGWAVDDELEDTVALTNYFRTHIARPDRTLLVGFSLGSFSVKLAEQGNALFDGFLPACGVLAGAPRAWDSAGVGLLAYSTAFGGMPATWGTVADGDDDVDAESEVFPILGGQLSSPANFGKFEFMRRVSGVPLSPSYYPFGLFTNMFFQTEARGELERRAGGPVVDNEGHVYWLSPADYAALLAFGVPPATVDAWLAQMNATHYSAPPSSANYLKHNADFSGKIKKPVLTMHTVIDTLVPVQHEAAYLETVTAAGRTDLLRQVYTTGTSHCGFTPTQIFYSIGKLDQWVQTGTAPSAASFPAVLGYVPGYTPAPWPQP